MEGMTRDEWEDMADEWRSERLDAGLFLLQALDVILAWLVGEDDGAGKRIIELLRANGASLDSLSASLKEQMDGIESDDNEQAKSTREMLEALLRCVEGGKFLSLS